MIEPKSQFIILFDQDITFYGEIYVLRRNLFVCALFKLKSFLNFRRLTMVNVNILMTVISNQTSIYMNSFQSRNEHVRCVNLRDCLANFISYSQFPDDLYPFLFSALILFFTLKMFQYSIRVALSLIRPIAFFVIVLVTEFSLFQSQLIFTKMNFQIVLPHLHEIKTWTSSNSVLSTAVSYVDEFVEYISNLFHAFCSRTIISLYPKFSA